MRLLVCGGRDYSNREEMNRILDKMASVFKIEVVIEGAATGADSMSAAWASSRNYAVEAYPADWNRQPDGSYDRSAGPRRNQRMIDEGHPDLVVAFPTVGSKGTWDMVNRSRAAGITTWIMLADESKIDAIGEGVFV